MGLLISRFRSKKSTIEILENIDKDINRLQKNRKQNQERQKKIVTSLLIYSIAAYILSAIIFFVYYFPDTWKLRFLYSLPLLIFPLLIWGLKKLLHWYFVKRIASNDGELLKLREQKKQILEDVMETETYKKAKEILEKFDPVRFRKLEALPEGGTSPSGPGGTPGTVIHQRSGGVRPVAPRAGLVQQQRQVTARTPVSTPRMPVPQPRPMPAPTPVKTFTPYPVTPNLPPRYPVGQPSSAGQPQASSVSRQPPQQQQQQMGSTPVIPRGYAMPPGPPMPRTILPQQRGTMDRIMDYLVGDGPENRYALICQFCYSHNGMALKEEFEYLTFRCCYCYQVNPARKQRPMAPRLEFFAPRGRNFNTDSQGSAASDEGSDDEEDGDSEGEEGENRSPATRSDNNVQARQEALGRGRGDMKRSVRDSAAVTVNRSSNAIATSNTVKNPSTPSKPGDKQQRPIPPQPIPGPQGQKRFSGVGTKDAAAKKKDDGADKSEITAKPKTSSKLFEAEGKTQSESLEKSESSVVKSGTQGQKMEQMKSQGSVERGSHCEVVHNDASINSDITPALSFVSADGEDNSDIPFVDEGEDNLQMSDGPTNEDMLSFVSGNTDDQMETYTSIPFETDMKSSLSTSLAELGNLLDSPRDGICQSPQDTGEGGGPTLSQEIRDSVQSLLSPSTMAAVSDDRDGKSSQRWEDHVFTSLESKEQDHTIATSSIQPSE